MGIIQELLQSIVAEATKQGSLAMMVLLLVVMACGGVIAILWKSYNDIQKKNDDLHVRNQDLLREMIDLQKDYNDEKTKLVEEINKTITMILSTAQVKKEQL